MRSLRKLAVLVAAAMPVLVQAAELSTAQRLELLERRVARVSDLTLQLDEMRRENRQLRGEVENLGYEIEQLKRKQRDIYLDIDQRLSGLQPGASAVSPPSADTTRPVAQVESRAPQASASREQIQAEYKAAYDLLSPQQKRYTESAAAFAAFVDRYPDDELTPNAKYWLGEAYYVSQQNAKALQAFETVVADHPGSTKAPAALFKIGRLQQVAGKAGAARAAFERVLKDYPNAPAAGLARQQLKQLGG